MCIGKDPPSTYKAAWCLSATKFQKSSHLSSNTTITLIITICTNTTTIQIITILIISNTRKLEQEQILRSPTGRGSTWNSSDGQTRHTLQSESLPNKRIVSTEFYFTMYLVRPNTLYKVNCYPTQRVVLWNGVPGTRQILWNGSYCTLRHNASYKKCYPIEQFRLIHATLCFPCECCSFWYCLTEGRLLFVCSTVLGGWCKTECYCANLIFVFFLHNRNLRQRNFTLESAWICNKSCLLTKLCVKVYTVCTAVFFAFQLENFTYG